MKEIDFDAIDDEIYLNKNIIYGAGYNGRVLKELFDKNKISVDAFYDDDRSRWGEEYCGKKILSQNDLLGLDRLATNMIISSMYVGQISKKIQDFGFEKVFTVVELLLQKDTEDFGFYKYQDDKEYIKKLNRLIDASTDDKTKEYFEIIKKTVLQGKAIKEIVNLCSTEKQYFLECFRGKLDGFYFVDAGAYTGDTIREILMGGIKPARIYCFEADYTNFAKLERFRNQCNEKDKIFCEHYALWNIHTKLGMKFANYNARIDLNCRETLVETTTIDEYFKNIKVDFIKMDIEGAERYALTGGINTIRRDRPILAISIYHGMDDIVEIPMMLTCKLDDYKYIVRHHSYTYSETVLYGVPAELNIW